MMRQMMGERMSGLFLFANVRAIQEKLELRFFFLGGLENA
jgi:hypothetical protein